MMINPIAPVPTNVVDYGQYNYPKTSKTITTTREYDEKGNLVKETIVETIYDGGSYNPYPYRFGQGVGSIQKDYTVTYNNDTEIR